MGFETPTGYQRPLKTSVNTDNSQVTNPLGGVLGGVFRLFATSCRWSFFVGNTGFEPVTSTMSR